MSGNNLGGPGMTMAPKGAIQNWAKNNPYSLTDAIIADPSGAIMAGFGSIGDLLGSAGSSISTSWDDLGGKGQADLVTGLLGAAGGFFGDSAAQELAEEQLDLQKQMFAFNKGNAMYGRDTDAWKWDRQQASNAGQTPGGDFAARPQLNDYV